jgi:putative transposase
MTDEEKMRIAKFRFGIISEFVIGVRLARGEREALLREKSSRQYQIPDSHRTRVSKGAILLWIQKYRCAGNNLSGLMPCKRVDAGKYPSLKVGVRMAMREMREENPNVTLNQIIATLKSKSLLEPEEKINRTACYNFLNTIQTPTKGENADRRAFEAQYPNGIWQCDVLHGPHLYDEKGIQRKSYLIAILDDHSRLIAHGEFYFDEKAESLKKCLYQAVQKRGLPQKFYVDNGSCYRAEAISDSCAWMGIDLLHSRPYTPQGRGKIERFFRTVRNEFLSIQEGLCKTKEAMNESFSDWLEAYHSRIHGTTGKTPLEKYTADMTSIRSAPHNLEDLFRTKETRCVRKDRTIQLNGKFYEVPQGLIGKKVELRFFDNQPERIEVYYCGKSMGFVRPLDLHLNANIGRDFSSSQQFGAVKQKITKEETNNRHAHPETYTISGGKIFGE